MRLTILIKIVNIFLLLFHVRCSPTGPHTSAGSSNALAHDSERVKQEMGVVSGDLQSVRVCVCVRWTEEARGSAGNKSEA